MPRQLDKLFGRDPRRKTAVWIQDHLPDGKWLQAHLPDPKTLPRSAMRAGSSLSSPLWPTFIAAAGAGVAFWWWTQWARGRAETEAREAEALAAAKPAPVETAAETPADLEAAALAAAKPAPVETAAETPADLEAAARGATGAPFAGLDDGAVETVDASLGVQGAEAKPKAPRKRKPAAAAAPTTH